MASLLVFALMQLGAASFPGDKSAASESAFTFRLPARGRECFYMDVDQGDALEIEFQVVTGGNLDVDFDIRDPAGKVIDTGSRRQDALYEGVANQKGTYQLCLSNAFSQVTPKEIFLLMVRDNGQDPAQQAAAAGSATEEEGAMMTFNAIGAKLHNHLQSVIVLQDHLRVRERRHRKTAENNLARVANWSLFEMVVVMVVGFAQVVAIRRFFKDRDGGKPAP